MSYLKKVEKQKEANRQATLKEKLRYERASKAAAKSNPVPVQTSSKWKEWFDKQTSHLTKKSVQLREKWAAEKKAKEEAEESK